MALPDKLNNGELALEWRNTINDLIDVVDVLDNFDASPLQAQVDTNTTNITTLDSRVTVNEGDITTLDSRVTVNEGDITTLQSFVNDGRIISVSSLSISPIENTLYELTVSSGVYPTGYYLYDGIGWVCIQQNDSVSISSSSGSLSATLVPGVTYDLNVTEDITVLAIDLETYGSSVINTTNSASPLNTISEPTIGYKRKSTGLDDISTQYAEIIVSKSNLGVTYSAVELALIIP